MQIRPAQPPASTPPEGKHLPDPAFVEEPSGEGRDQERQPHQRDEHDAPVPIEQPAVESAEEALRVKEAGIALYLTSIWIQVHLAHLPIRHTHVCDGGRVLLHRHVGRPWRVYSQILPVGEGCSHGVVHGGPVDRCVLRLDLLGGVDPAIDLVRQRRDSARQADHEKQQAEVEPNPAM